MSRTLLTSETIILIEAGATSPRKVLASQSVWRELHAPPHETGQQQWFNTDFVVELTERDSSENRQVRGVPVRPYSLGGDFFVLLSAEGTPIRMELLEGESIPKSSFKEEVHRIDSAIKSLPTLPQHLSTWRTPYLRIARLSNSVAFLMSSTTAISEVLSAKPVFVAAGDDLIEHRSAAGHLLIDGVLYD
jgi:hypothetical protein